MQEANFVPCFDRLTQLLELLQRPRCQQEEHVWCPFQHQRHLVIANLHNVHKPHTARPGTHVHTAEGSRFMRPVLGRKDLDDHFELREEWKLDTLCDLYETLTITQAIIY